MFGWLDLVVGAGMPFSIVENMLVRKYSTLKPISVDTFMKYMGKLAATVEAEIKGALFLDPILPSSSAS